jgi:hypothetical protein
MRREPPARICALRTEASTITDTGLAPGGSHRRFSARHDLASDVGFSACGGWIASALSSTRPHAAYCQICQFTGFMQAC